MRKIPALCVCVLSTALVWSAMAQSLPPVPNSTRLDVQTLNFDMWCQETEKLPESRCDKRLPEDEQAFETYRAKIEKYEIEYLREKDRESTFNRYMQSDPLDNPVNRPQQPPSPKP